MWSNSNRRRAAQRRPLSATNVHCAPSRSYTSRRTAAEIARRCWAEPTTGCTEGAPPGGVTDRALRPTLHELSQCKLHQRRQFTVRQAMAGDGPGTLDQSAELATGRKMHAEAAF